MSALYGRDDLQRVRTDEVRPGMLLARPCPHDRGAWTAVEVRGAGPDGWDDAWQADVWRVVAVDGASYTQPSDLDVTVVAR